MPDVLGLGLAHIVSEGDRALLGFVLGIILWPAGGILVQQWRGAVLHEGR